MLGLGTVSVVIPCFNAEQWIAEAIDSCLQQTYSPIEIIVVDDGSTDGSLDVIKRYGDRVKWESGPNLGGNHARNRGFALSSGEFIQYLDADDYLLPEKLERQIQFLKETGADVVYGDWRHQQHLPNGQIVLEDVKVTGAQPDVLESLLTNWWVSPACLLFRRSAVERSGGWDETIQAGQDRDFFLAVVTNGAEVAYQPGCYSIYRRYGNVTVSTRSRDKCLQNHLLILQKYENWLVQNRLFNSKYKKALAQSYFSIARGYLFLENVPLYSRFLKRVLDLDPEFVAMDRERSRLYSTIQKIIGFQNLERITASIKRFKISIKRLKSSILNTNIKTTAKSFD